MCVRRIEKKQVGFQLIDEGDSAAPTWRGANSMGLFDKLRGKRRVSADELAGFLVMMAFESAFRGDTALYSSLAEADSAGELPGSAR